MPPRHVYWTILIGNAPTAFRAHDRADLVPTFERLKQKQPGVTMKYFARGRLWESPEEARRAVASSAADGSARPRLAPRRVASGSSRSIQAQERQTAVQRTSGNDRQDERRTRARGAEHGPTSTEHGAEAQERQSSAVAGRRSRSRLPKPPAFGKPKPFGKPGPRSQTSWRPQTVWRPKTIRRSEAFWRSATMVWRSETVRRPRAVPAIGVPLAIANLLVRGNHSRTEVVWRAEAVQRPEAIPSLRRAEDHRRNRRKKSASNRGARTAAGLSRKCAVDRPSGPLYASLRSWRGGADDDPRDAAARAYRDSVDSKLQVGRRVRLGTSVRSRSPRSTSSSLSRLTSRTNGRFQTISPIQLISNWVRCSTRRARTRSLVTSNWERCRNCSNCLASSSRSDAASRSLHA